VDRPSLRNERVHDALKGLNDLFKALKCNKKRFDARLHADVKFYFKQNATCAERKRTAQPKIKEIRSEFTRMFRR